MEIETTLRSTNVNRILFSILSLIVISVLVLMIATPLGVKENLGLYVGSLALAYCVLTPFLAVNNKRIGILWFIFSFISSFVALIPMHIYLSVVVFKNGWLK